MSKTSFPVCLGLVVGAMFAAVHALWSLLVALGLAHSLMSASMRLHMVSASVSVLPFSLGSAVVLVVVTGVFGFVVGWVAGAIWERCGK